MNGHEPQDERYERGSRLVEDFVSLFGESYLPLAYHAALPLALTPELLKYLRHEFLPWMHWVAEVDLLLSDLCIEAGPDLYAMKREARAYLIKKMRKDEKLGEPRIEAVNKSLIKCLGHLARSNPAILPHEWQAQEWGAMLYISAERDKAARALAEVIYRHIVPGEGGATGRIADHPGLARLSRLIRESASELKQYQDLVRLAELTGRILADASGEFVEQLRQSGKLSQTFQLPGVAVELPLLEFVASARSGGIGLVFVAQSQSINPGLHQLPSPPPDFTGRERELNELLAKLGQGVTISGMHGLGGVGKTALALKLAERVKDRFPDAQIYLDMQGAGANPLTPATAMEHVIRAYHPMAKLPESPSELSALYRSTLQGQRALLLMDNARDREQIEPLIPPAGCVLLVTSRRHFTLPGMFDQNLDTLPRADAIKLLLSIAARIGDHAAEIARLCGYLPLALRVAAGALAERPNLAPADYVLRLADAKERLIHLNEVDITLNVSYEMLTKEQQRLWCALSVFPHMFDDEAAAAVGGGHSMPRNLHSVNL